MLSRNVLILALTLTYLTVFVSAWDCKDTNCSDDDVKALKISDAEMKGCEGKVGKHLTNCTIMAQKAFKDAQPAAEMQKRNCNLYNMNKMKDGEDKDCCKAAMDYLNDCKTKSL